MNKFFPPLIIPLLFVLDRLSKSIAVAALSEGQSYPVWAGVFHLTRVNNTGAAFGVLKEKPGLLTVVSIGCVLVITAILFKDFSKKRSLDSPLRNLGLMTVVAGAAGNLYDRIRYGYVIDFLDFRVWPVFNIADAAISVGIFLMMVSLFKMKKAS